MIAIAAKSLKKSTDVTEQLLQLVKSQQEARQKAEEEMQKFQIQSKTADEVLLDTIQEARDIFAIFYDPPAVNENADREKQ